MADTSQVLEWKEWIAKIFAFVLGMGGFKVYSIYTEGKKLPGEIDHKEAETDNLKAQTEVALSQMAIEMVSRVKAENDRLYQEIEELRRERVSHEKTISDLMHQNESLQKVVDRKAGNGKVH